MKKIKLTRGKECMVDDDDYGFLSKRHWHCNESLGRHYAACNAGGCGCSNHKYMHRIIMNPSIQQGVDHIDGNGLNNQRANLRLCNQKQNIANAKPYKNSKSGVKGVSKHISGKWRVTIGFENKNIYIGLFKSFEEACKRRNQAEKKYFGRFAHSYNH